MAFGADQYEQSKWKSYRRERPSCAAVPCSSWVVIHELVLCMIMRVLHVAILGKIVSN